MDFTKLSQIAKQVREEAEEIGCIAIDFRFQDEIVAEFFVRGGIPRLLELAEDGEEVVIERTNATYHNGGGYMHYIYFVRDGIKYFVTGNEKDIQDNGLILPSITSPAVLSEPV
jgi:hypothetical protein